jgi:hypothetical protein
MRAPWWDVKDGFRTQEWEGLIEKLILTLPFKASYFPVFQSS